MPQHTSSLHAFDLRSVVLFTCLTVGGTTALLAQNTSPAGASDKAAATTQTQASKPLTASQSFARSDLDRNQELSRAEAQNLPSVAAQFDAWDSDGNGSLSLKEFLLGAHKTD